MHVCIWHIESSYEITNIPYAFCDLFIIKPQNLTYTRVKSRKTLILLKSLQIATDQHNVKQENIPGKPQYK